jgi:Arc/MetJ-type ribon-helix-helix transcriptional regulator
MPKKKITISIDEKLYDWLKHQVDSEERTFASISHAIEYCIAYLKKDKDFELKSLNLPKKQKSNLDQ